MVSTSSIAYMNLLLVRVPMAQVGSMQRDVYLWKVETPDPGQPGNLICVKEDGVFICASDGVVL